MTLGIIFAFVQAFTWSCTSIVLRNLSTRLDPFLVNGVRAIFGLVVLIPILLLTANLQDFALISPTAMIYLIGSVVLGGVFGDALYVMSLKSLGVSAAFPISNSFPLFTVIFSTLLLGTPIEWSTVVGMVLVLGGIYFVARPQGSVDDNTKAPKPSRQLIFGVLAALGAALLWGLNTVVMSMGIEGINGAVANTVRMPAVILISFVLAAWRGQTSALRQIDRRTMQLLILAGILGWGFSAYFWVMAVQLAGPNKTSIISATSPLFAVPLSALLLNERPTRYTWIGTALTTVGVLFVI